MQTVFVTQLFQGTIMPLSSILILFHLKINMAYSQFHGQSHPYAQNYTDIIATHKKKKKKK